MSYDGSAHVWRNLDGQLLFRTEKVDEQLFGVAISPDMRLLVAGGYNGTLRYFDADTGASLMIEEESFLGPVTGIEFAPNGASLFVATNGRSLHRVPIGSTGQASRNWMNVTLPRPVKTKLGATRRPVNIAQDDLHICRELAATLEQDGIIPGGGVIPSPDYAGAIHICERAVTATDDPCLRLSLARMYYLDDNSIRGSDEMNRAAEGGCKAASLLLAQSSQGRASGPTTDRAARAKAFELLGDAADVFRMLSFL